jgi:hypothetical protein
MTDDLEVEGRSLMSKSGLIGPISRQGGVKVNAIINEELPRLGLNHWFVCSHVNNQRLVHRGNERMWSRAA